MSEKSMIVYYFTGTGNSLKAARDIAEICDGTVASMRTPITQAEHYDAVGFVFPVYHSSMPNAVERFIRESTFDSDYFFAVAICGNPMGGLGGGEYVSSIAEVLREKGIALDYGKVCTGYPSYIAAYPMFRNRKHVPAGQDRRIAKIAEEIRNRAKTEIPPVSESICKAAANRAKYPDMDRDYTVSDDCTKCGMCAKICPVENISMSNGKPQFLHKCEQCMACIQWCPQKVINTPKTIKRRRYHHPAVTLNDLMV